MKMDPDIAKLSEVIAFASEMERRKIPIDLEDRLILVNATYEYVDKIMPVYKKYCWRINEKS